MQGTVVQTFVCAIIIMNSVSCTETNVKYINTNLFEGSVVIQSATASVHVCVAMCDQHRPSCQGSRYNKGSNECQLLDKWSSIQISTLYSDTTWAIYVKVNIYLCKTKHILNMNI